MPRAAPPVFAYCSPTVSVILLTGRLCPARRAPSSLAASRALVAALSRCGGRSHAPLSQRQCRPAPHGGAVAATTVGPALMTPFFLPRPVLASGRSNPSSAKAVRGTDVDKYSDTLMPRRCFPPCFSPVAAPPCLPPSLRPTRPALLSTYPVRSYPPLGIIMFMFSRVRQGVPGPPRGLAQERPGKGTERTGNVVSRDSFPRFAPPARHEPARNPSLNCPAAARLGFSPPPSSITTPPRTQVVVKMAKEFGAEERWMNERMMRAAPASCASYIGTLTCGSLRHPYPPSHPPSHPPTHPPTHEHPVGYQQAKATPGV